MELEPLEFDTLEPIVVPVRIGTEQYELREASVDAAKAYRNALMASRKQLPDGTSTVQGMASADVLYVSMSLYNSKGGRVPVEVLDTWPQKILTKLLARLEEISDSNASDPPERKALEAVLSLPDSPVSYETFVEWVNGLKGARYRPLQTMLKDVGELAKNGQAGTPVASN